MEKVLQTLETMELPKANSTDQAEKLVQVQLDVLQTLKFVLSRVYEERLARNDFVADVMLDDVEFVHMRQIALFRSVQTVNNHVERVMQSLNESKEGMQEDYIDRMTTDFGDALDAWRQNEPNLSKTKLQTLVSCLQKGANLFHLLHSESTNSNADQQ